MNLSDFIANQYAVLVKYSTANLCYQISSHMDRFTGQVFAERTMPVQSIMNGPRHPQPISMCSLGATLWTPDAAYTVSNIFPYARDQHRLLASLYDSGPMRSSPEFQLAVPESSCIYATGVNDPYDDTFCGLATNAYQVLPNFNGDIRVITCNNAAELLRQGLTLVNICRSRQYLNDGVFPNRLYAFTEEDAVVASAILKD